MAGKTKIALLAEDLVQNGLTEEKLAAFARCLRRSDSDYNRNQHCYTTAMRFPAERWEEAVRLIRFGMETYGEDTLGLDMAREALALVYERAGQYGTACSIYETLGEKNSWGLLRTRIHAEQFHCTGALAEAYAQCLARGEFEQELLQNRFYLLLARLILAREAGNRAEAADSLHKLRELCVPGYRGTLYEIFKKHRWEEQLRIPTEARAYLAEAETKLEEK